MWVFTKHGFFSIVQDKDDEGYLVARSRVKGDLETLIYGSIYVTGAIEETINSDYRYRIRVPKDILSSIIAREVMDIDYTNYKAAVGMVDKRRSEWYGMVWAIMADMQEHFLNEEE